MTETDDRSHTTAGQQERGPSSLGVRVGTEHTGRAARRSSAGRPGRRRPCPGPRCAAARRRRRLGRRPGRRGRGRRSSGQAPCAPRGAGGPAPAAPRGRSAWPAGRRGNQHRAINAAAGTAVAAAVAVLQREHRVHHVVRVVPQPAAPRGRSARPALSQCNHHWPAQKAAMHAVPCTLPWQQQGQAETTFSEWLLLLTHVLRSFLQGCHRAGIS